jgi:hypothetical protein
MTQKQWRTNKSNGGKRKPLNGIVQVRAQIVEWRRIESHRTPGASITA